MRSLTLCVLLFCIGLPMQIHAKSIDPCAVKLSEKNQDNEEWANFEFHGQKVGYIHGKKTTKKDEIEIRQETVIEVARGSDQIKMESILISRFKAKDGSPIEFTHTRKEGDAERMIHGYRAKSGNIFVIEQSVGGNTQKKNILLTPNTYLSSSVDHVLIPKFWSGETVRGFILVEEEGEKLDFEVKPDLLKKDDACAIKAFRSQMGPIEARTTYDKDRHTIRSTLPALGAQMVRTTRDDALLPGPMIDLFAAGQFELSSKLPHRNQIKTWTLQLHGNPRPAPVVDDTHRVHAIDHDTVELTITQSAAPKTTEIKLPYPKSVAPMFLSETPYEALSDGELKQTAKKFIDVKNKKGPWAAAQAINTFVFTHIKNKSLKQAFSSATEALRAQEGDCTEHAILFSALAKITGIPTRLLTGLVYVETPKPLMGYHEWAEVFVDGRWIPMDPTFNQAPADPTHIPFAKGLSDAAGLRDAGMKAAALVGNLKIESISTSGLGRE